MLRRLPILFVAGLGLLAQEQRESLLIGPGDLIQVDVMDTPEMEQQVRVIDDSSIRLAYLGNIKVGGLTPADAALQIQHALVEKNIMRHPQVTVRIQESAAGAISILGEVKNPGTYSLSRSESILKVLSMAGGLAEMANRHIVIERAGSRSNAIPYYVSNDAVQAINDAVLVFPGDTVVVPKAPFIYIMGDVVRPGGYAMTTTDSHLTVLQAVAMAGSANKTSVESKVRLIRPSVAGLQEMAVRLDLIQRGKAPDIALQPNDIIYVPFSWTKNIALNASSIAASTAGAAVYAMP